MRPIKENEQYPRADYDRPHVAPHFASVAAFSLVELSIVLVILGLLVGGVMTGQNLIRAAELRAVTTEFNQYQTAINIFKEKYFQLPGDMNNAHQFWGSAGGSGVIGDGCETATGTGTQTCSGDGNGEVGETSANEYTEVFTFWQHLANAGLIEGAYTGKAGAGAPDAALPENAPNSKIGNALWFTDWEGSATGYSGMFDGEYGNTLQVGGIASNDDPDEPILLPEEAWNIDTKIDDGMPATGRLRVEKRVNCAVQADGTALTTSAADAAKTDSIYNLADSALRCALLFASAY